MERLLNEEKYKKYSTGLVFIMLISSFLSELGPFGVVLRPLYPIMLAAAIILSGYKFIDNYKKGKTISTNTLILAIFLLINFISTIINYEYGLLENLDNLILMAVLIFFLYENEKDSENKEENIIKLSKIIVKISAILTSISLITYVLAISYYTPYPFYIGFDPNTNRLWGIFNPNAGSMLGVITIGLSLYLFENELSKKERRLSIYNIVVQFIYLVLAQSRSGILALFALLGVYFIAKFFNNVRPELSEENYSRKEMESISFSKLKRNRFIGSIMLAIAAVIVIAVAMKPLTSVLGVVPKTTVNIVNSFTQEESNESEETENSSFFISSNEANTSFDPGRKDSEAHKNPNRGRLAYWSSALDNIEDSPLIGYSYEGIITEVQNDVRDGTNYIENGGLHNTLLTVLGASGLLGFIVYAIWLLRQNIQILSYLYNEYVVHHKLNMKIVILYAIIIAVYLADLAESRTLYTMSFYSLFTWTLTGVLNRETSVETIPVRKPVFTQRDVLSQDLG